MNVLNIAVIGECMLELNRLASDDSSAPLPVGLSYGGDTLNTSIYLARMGIAADYVTALGDDSMSRWMVEQWQSEGVGVELTQLVPGAVPGLYMIEVDADGERSFLYWRKDSPATKLFDEPESATRLFAKLLGFDAIYLSGITLALYSAQALERLFAFLAEYRTQGGKVYFDGNYRPKLWGSQHEAKRRYEQIYQLTDIALPTIEDEQAVFGEEDPDTILARIHSFGVSEVVLKMGGNGCLVSDKKFRGLVESNKVEVVDTTSAGDSFNAGYLANRMAGDEPRKAALAGHKLASVVIQHRGAIIPKSAMP